MHTLVGAYEMALSLHCSRKSVRPFSPTLLSMGAHTVLIGSHKSGPSCPLHARKVYGFRHEWLRVSLAIRADDRSGETPGDLARSRICAPKRTEINCLPPNQRHRAVPSSIQEHVHPISLELVPSISTSIIQSRSSSSWESFTRLALSVTPGYT
ncbi:hypothetical protein GQ44DRAFT_279481 [Phaeosphaeriaceae sp. PMI808]|nr:hypothetical protein GQ44DRAFT_279481 [Phaeosphaeriaceae sp. PMI808]